MGFIATYLSGCIIIDKSHNAVSDKKKADTFLQLGVRYLEINRVEEAKKNLDRAVNLDADNAEINNVLGIIYERLQQPKMAKKHYQRAFSIAADNVSINNNYGRFLCEKDQHQEKEEGTRLLKQALTMPQNNRKWLTYTLIGRCELKHGNQASAETYFRQALQQNKQYSGALVQMQKISYIKGNFLSARGFLARYLVVARHTAETLWYAIQTERVLGNGELLTQYQHALLILFPTSKEAEQLRGVGDDNSKN